jgi:hypothetical protein
MQGSIAEVAGGGRQTVLFGCDDPALAVGLLEANAAVEQAVAEPGGVRIVLSADAARDADRALAAINATLVSAGLAVYRIEPTRVSLEERFLDLTSRLEVTA